MVEEGVRRAGRGADVVIGILDDTGRESVEKLAACLERVPTIDGADGCPELDVDALLARRPKIVLVDNLAHRVDPHTGRWEAVEKIVSGGIDVITTVNISNLESMGDVVAAITGSAADETVPDSVVRAADQIELVDMSPEALRRRLAHGHVYPPDRIDTALAERVPPGSARQAPPAEPVVVGRQSRRTARTADVERRTRRHPWSARAGGRRPGWARW